ncbi:MAG TPA: cytochrome P450 [Steroidobacter sp.]|nr:cytochrome P450 [Steroidobacter sp.]
MNHPNIANPGEEWDPRSPTVLRDQIAAYDDMRHRCPVARSDYLHWSLFRHADVLRVLHDPATFSNAVSAHVSVPNGMDPPMHTEFRRIIEPYFGRKRMEAFEPVCRRLAAELMKKLPTDRPVEIMSGLAQAFALEMQSAFLGWPAQLHEPLRKWAIKNREATLARDPVATAEVAREFDGYIREIIAERRRQPLSDDVTSSLLQQRVCNRPLEDEEIVSILRNWTVGELTTISASVGILVYYLAEHTSVQDQLRQKPALLPAAIDEILRIHPPLIANRRKATQAVNIGGRSIAANERLTLMWASANRDESVFGDPDEFRLDRDPADNLLYGAGIHVCPGAPLARLELRVLLEELLRRTARILPQADGAPIRAIYPASGYSEAWIVLEGASEQRVAISTEWEEAVSG